MLQMADGDGTNDPNPLPAISFQGPIADAHIANTRQPASNERLPNIPAAVPGQVPTDNQRRRILDDDSSLEFEGGELELKYGARNLIMLVVPVSLCMLVVVLTMTTIDYYTQKDFYLVYTPFHSGDTDTFTLMWESAANALILLCVVIFMTMLLITLYKMECYKVIRVWLIGSSMLLLFFFTATYLRQLCFTYNFPIDRISVIFIVWNFGVVGMICIHGDGPLCMQQAYLIVVSALMALVFIKYLPDWTTWLVLAVISVWDLVAVLCPRGPLRILVETAQERNEPIFPALIYSSTMVWLVGMADRQQPKNKNQARVGKVVGVNNPAMSNNEHEATASNAARSLNGNQNDVITSDVANAPGASVATNLPRPRSTGSTASEDKGIKLGLGDFIFYSVLVGKASSYGDWNTTIACFIAILIGLCLTLLLLAMWRKALPALPISIFFGLVFYFATSIIISPFITNLSYNMVFI